MEDQILKVRLVSPKRIIEEMDAFKVSLYASDGFMEIHPMHAPVIAKLGVGILTVYNHKFPHGDCIALFGGTAHFRDGVLTLIAIHLEVPDDIDVERAQSALGRARQRLSGVGQSITDGKLDAERALSSKLRAILRLQLKGVEVYE